MAVSTSESTAVEIGGVDGADLDKADDDRTSIGIAIFVKTPGVSPIKTRLAATIGQAAAEAFHRLAAAAVAEVATDPRLAHTGVNTYWAVAEDDALDAAIWNDLPRIAQGDGDLGARMHRVYDTMRAEHGAALLLGADAPQLQAEDLLTACAALREHDYVLGPSADGGFWTFGGRVAASDAAWTRTPWSQSDTHARFIAELRGDIATVRTLRDVDTVDDLRALQPALRALPAATPAQRALGEWLDGLRLSDTSSE
jgi:rSAM/selenodomain-associated transferase 1